MAKAGVIALGAQMAKDLKKHGIAVRGRRVHVGPNHYIIL